MPAKKHLEIEPGTQHLLKVFENRPIRIKSDGKWVDDEERVQIGLILVPKSLEGDPKEHACLGWFTKKYREGRFFAEYEDDIPAIGEDGELVPDDPR